MSRLSIRARLSVAFASAMLAILVLAGLFVYLRVAGNLDESLDESLTARGDDVAAAVSAASAGSLELGRERFEDSEDAFAQVIAAPGGALVSSTLPAHAGAVLTPAETAAAVTDGPVLLDRPDIRGVDGEARLLARAVTASGGVYVVVAGASTQDRDETLAGLRNAFLIGGPLGLLLASALGYALAGRALAPVETMRRRAAEITLERSGERLPLARADDEIRHLGETLNAMLDRIEASLEREREFVADAGHELRTPLAILKAELELAGRRERSPEELRAAIRSAAEEAERLARLAEDLLAIARSDRGSLPIKTEPVRLDGLLARVRDRFAAAAREQGRELTTEATPGAEAELDPLRIEQALGNLVDNALRHGRGTIALSARRDPDSVELAVSDEGAGVPAAFAPKAFERFTRADPGRSGGGAGLGLAIVRAIALAHGGEATVEGARFAIALPAR